MGQSYNKQWINHKNNRIIALERIAAVGEGVVVVGSLNVEYWSIFLPKSLALLKHRYCLALA